MKGLKMTGALAGVLMMAATTPMRRSRMQWLAF
ncbi:hypothetical protein B998_02987 [Brucella sp. F96/2]|nr:hypothetical protein C983_02768 [Brucella sp. F23/97]ENT12818.1 hypothetical protein B998_02987 [Brucella sp. F96/2]ENT19988.1 hypothetical protein C065_02129 [Brucella sp. UK1/97]